MKRMSDQALILEAVRDVRKELADAAEAKANTIETGKILVRLATLYALLDVQGLLGLVEKADARKEHDERKVA